MTTAPLIDFTLPEPPQVWLVVFVDPPGPGPDAPRANRALCAVLKLLRPGFRHVLAVSPHVTGGWLICNPGSCHLAISAAPDRDVLPPLVEAVERGRARCIATIARQPERIHLRGLFTCVNVVAHLIGVDCPPFTTPWRFYRRIAAMRQ